MKKWDQLLGLKGNSSYHSSSISNCQECSSKNLYMQVDFQRSLGLFFIGACSLLTILLNFAGYNWFVTWSPMLAGLLIDRSFSFVRPLAVICYECEHIHRGIPHDECLKYDDFDLEKHDRLQYAEDKP